MPTLIMTKGLPASGKSTWSKKQNAKRINKDDLRAMVDNGYINAREEKLILKARDALIKTYAETGKNIIIDDTNLHPKHEAHLRDLANKLGYGFRIKDFTDVPLVECLKRDRERADMVGEKAIKSMYNSFLKKKADVAQYVKPVVNPDLPTCIIVDIDGTIAHMDGRSPYDYSKVGTDVVDENVAEIVRRYALRDPILEIPDTYIVIVSGREDGCKQETLDWLEANRIPFDELHMRKNGDHRCDTIVKQEIYETWIKERYNVRFVLDDRDRVVKMWREIGLKCLQVEEGDF